MSQTAQHKSQQRQTAFVTVPFSRRAADICMCVVMLLLALAPCTFAADSSLGASHADESLALTMEDVMRLAESSSPSVASAKRAVELAMLQLQAAEAQKRPSITVHAAPLQIGIGPLSVQSVVEEDSKPMGKGETSMYALSQAGGDVRIPLGGGSLSLSATASFAFSDPALSGKSAWNGSASLSLPILGASSPGEAPSSTSSAQSQLRSAQFQLDQSIRQARASAQAAYFNLLAAEDRVAAADRGLSRARTHAAFVEGRCSAGNASELDALEAKAGADRAEAAAQSARHNLAIASISFNRAIGRDLDTLVHLAPAGEYVRWPEDLDLDTCTRAALETRPEIPMAEQDVADAEAALAQAIAAKRPDVFFQGQASSGGHWRVGLEVSALLTRDYAAEIAIESAKGRVEQAKANAVETRDSILLEVVEAFYNLREAESSVELARLAVAIATATLDIREEQCRIGAVAYAEVSEAIDAVRKAESDLAYQLAACFMAKSRLLQSVGYDNL